ncbi:hypothetical protein [Serratia sp. CY68341]
MYKISTVMVIVSQIIIFTLGGGAYAYSSESPVSTNKIRKEKAFSPTRSDLTALLIRPDVRPNFIPIA